MRLHRSVRWCLSSLCLILLAATVVSAADTPVAQVSRVEVVLADQYKGQVAALREEFAQAGLTNVHFQFAKLGQPPQNIGLGCAVPAELAREAIRLAAKYNFAVWILLPDRLFPPRFVTIASSNYDDTVEWPISPAQLAQLQNPELTTDQFHRLYREFTTSAADVKGRY